MAMVPIRTGRTKEYIYFQLIANVGIHVYYYLCDMFRRMITVTLRETVDTKEHSMLKTYRRRMCLISATRMRITRTSPRPLVPCLHSRFRRAVLSSAQRLHCAGMYVFVTTAKYCTEY